MEPSLEDSIRLVKNSTLYKEFLAERQEILRHKWIESERVGYDIGFERALLNWILKYRSAWLEDRRCFLLANSDQMRPILPCMPRPVAATNHAAVTKEKAPWFRASGPQLSRFCSRQMASDQIKLTLS
jgi:hypothetical protein